MFHIENLKKRMKKLKAFNLCRIKDLEEQNKKFFNAIVNKTDLQKISNIDFITMELNLYKEHYKNNLIKVNRLFYDLNIVDFSIWITKHDFQYCLSKNNLEYLNKLIMFYYMDVKIIPNIE